ncbi:hypothetical protein AMAG_15454 [Allomyces macrogynus ATCC 38327]|uniref:Transmembrane protein 135 N-terminal domain-containing protein n=1 Tax=Allomyces macrogynus (strain ATCC 38327) TaxID=578462 RepID=A0A0L0T812_ALLM3|nr:hypothetical protein AMAG_15454 [Allomyces macrogynus ATCC 38327]|eukprot:KNE70699.1 hypothetical protein AMAG_15454 [Allomyces macrogynus ATCC 38327]
MDPLATTVAEKATRATAKSAVSQLMTTEAFYQNFLELLAQLLSLCLTDEETEKIAKSLRHFHATIQRVSSRASLRPSWHSPSPVPCTADDAPSPTPRAVPEALRCRHQGTCVQNATRGWLRSLAVAYGVKWLVGTLPSILMGKVFQKPSLLKREFNGDTLRFALFVSTFISSYKSLFCAARYALAALRRRVTTEADETADEAAGVRLRKWAAFIAGALAGMAILIDNNPTRRTAICLYLLTRAGEFLAKFYFVRGARQGGRSDSASLHRLPPPAATTDGTATPATEVDDEGISIDSYPATSVATPAAPSTVSQPVPRSLVARLVTAFLVHLRRMYANLPRYIAASTGAVVMMLSSAQILFSFVAMPGTLASSYLSFLLTHSGIRDKVGVLTPHYMRHMGRVLWETCGYPHLADKFIPWGGGPPVERLPLADTLSISGHRSAMCSVIHPETASCAGYSARCFGHAFRRSARLYLPLNVLMTIILGSKRLRSAPLNSIARLLFNTARSSVFLAGYVTTAWTMTCTLRALLGRDAVPIYVINGIASGAWSLLEPSGRRLELALYCLPRALESFWRCLLDVGVIPQLPTDPVARAKVGFVQRVLVRVLSEKKVGEPLYFAAAMGALMMLYETEQHIISPGYKKVMRRFFGVN